MVSKPVTKHLAVLLALACAPTTNPSPQRADFLKTKVSKGPARNREPPRFAFEARTIPNVVAKGGQAVDSFCHSQKAKPPVNVGASPVGSSGHNCLALFSVQ